MRTTVITGTLAAVAFHLLALHVVHAQGTIYLSNLDQTSAGDLAVGSDSWHAELFSTGTNSAGYLLNSIQLLMSPALRNPGGFTVTLHTNVSPFGAIVGGSIGRLIGVSNPGASGIYTYTPPGPITLSGRGLYYIVVTAETPAATGAYQWSAASSFSYASPDGWLAGPVSHSSNGSSWIRDLSTYPQFAVTATAIPEPFLFAVLGLGGALLAARRFRARAH